MYIIILSRYLEKILMSSQTDKKKHSTKVKIINWPFNIWLTKNMEETGEWKKMSENTLQRLVGEHIQMKINYVSIIEKLCSICVINCF